MKILYRGSLWPGSTSLQRSRSFARQPDVKVIEMDSGLRMGRRNPLWHRIRWKLRWPVDVGHDNEQLIHACKQHHPDVILVDNSKVVSRATLRRLRSIRGVVLAYYTPDDVMGRHNLSYPLLQSFPEWDVFFTTKSFNVPELRAAGVRRPFLIGKAFDEALHRPMSAEEVGPDFEKFDLVFIGAHEAQRCASVNALAESGLSVVVYGSGLGRWQRKDVRPNVELRESLFDADYTKAMHHGKIALCFLRKLNRDKITQRTMEIAAMGRPMLAERTDEHDEHFRNEVEYAGFSDDASLVSLARRLLGDDSLRASMGSAARARAVASGYSVDARCAEMVGEFRRRLGRERVE